VKILFLGDLVGGPGRRIVQSEVPRLKKELGLDLVVVNGENMAGGSGITPKLARQVFQCEVDLMTSGDHLWRQKEVIELLESDPRLVRPANYPAGTVGSGSTVLRKEGLPPFGLLNLQGRTFMAPLDNPFEAALSLVEDLRKETPLILLDFHAEATSEKIAMGRMLDGKVSAVVGTHTHVQTADEQIFPGGTAFICDVGFNGAHESVLGREIRPVIRRFIDYMPQRFPVAKNLWRLNGVVIEIDNDSGKSTSIERLSYPVENPDAAGSEPKKV
jgi:hypothetical protein